MKLLTPGAGHEVANLEKAVGYIVEHIIDADSYDVSSGQVMSVDGVTYHVSACAEITEVFVETPGIDASGLLTLMYRQIENDNRAFIYEVDPQNIALAPNSNTAGWQDIGAAATRIWICVGDRIKLVDQRK